MREGWGNRRYVGLIGLGGMNNLPGQLCKRSVKGSLPNDLTWIWRSTSSTSWNRGMREYRDWEVEVVQRFRKMIFPSRMWGKMATCFEFGLRVSRSIDLFVWGLGVRFRWGKVFKKYNYMHRTFRTIGCLVVTEVRWRHSTGIFICRVRWPPGG